MRSDTTLANARTGSREVYHGKAHGWCTTEVYDRDLLSAGTRIDGPAVIEEMSSTTVLGPRHHATVDAYGTLVISLAAQTRAAPDRPKQARAAMRSTELSL